ncbi:SusC/RagA family TonB-linked outer membrane protein [Tunicatimonas pelagia]|uniref:SusC/RagA family TonB-linked outer membrane protein n=1 Tax=Tunicatimonas pelagia TaxID=931531 RepID=UPI0026651777|nr:TonB-dependent receptor [Tunicatimonas pelagia]WKN45701.1 TonB-dependent receptor [Tunicatimonas pelagia]
MKRKLLDSIIMLSRYSVYAFAIQSIFFNGLMAESSRAQIKSIKEVFITIEIQQSNTQEIFRAIEEQSAFKFTYDAADVDNKAVFNIPRRKLSVADVLAIVSRKTSLQFKQHNENIDVRKVVVPQPEVPPSPVAISISGTVTDEEDKPLPGATVLVKGTTVGTVTDINGQYKLSAPDDATTLVFSFVGYVEEEITINGRSTIDLVMFPDIQSLGEIVVVGYGTQKKEDITGSVASVESYRLEDVPNTNFAQALQGAVSGVYINNNSGGAEGGDVNIRIRGQNSITANNQPLIVLDGVPFSGNISQINQNDIASIEVLKDVSSSAIYGTRGANGVILITTKQGEVGKPVVSYSGYIGVQNAVNVPDLMTGDEFYDFKLERLNATDDPTSVMSQTELDNFAAGTYADWIDLSTRTSVQQEHSLSISSGTENTKFYVSGTYLGVRGIAQGDDFKRYNLRLNLDQQITDWLAIGTNTRLGYIDRSGVEVDLASAFYINPLTNPYDENGRLTVYPWPEDEFFGNPLGRTLFDNEDEEYTVFSNLYANISFPFIEGLSYKLNAGYEYSNRDNNVYRGRDTKNGFESRGSLTNRQVRDRNYLVENILTYKKIIDKHNFDITALYSGQLSDFQRFNTDAEGFPNDILGFYQAEIASLITPTNIYRRSTLVSQMGRLNYNYDGRYLLTLTARRDGFSGFGSDQKYAFFPSVALGWNVGNENFLEGSTAVSALKLRLSAGRIGNQAIDPFQTLARLATQNYLGGDNGGSLAAGFIPSTLGDNGLGWETTTSANIGVDYGFLNNRIRGSLEYYVSNTEDLLLSRAISSVHGITSIVQNIGETRNNGLEILVSGDIIRQEKLTWTADLNFSFNRNEIVDLYGDGQDDVGNRWFIGQPIDVNYGFVFDGIWQESESDVAEGFDAVPGDVKIKDQNSDDEITADDDRAIFGNLQPDFIAGLGSTISYGDFALTFFLFTEQGVERPNRLLDSDREVFLLDARRNGVQREWWSPTNPINSYPRNSDDSNPRGVLFLEDASFIRMRDVTLSYNLPTSSLERVGLQSARVYTTVRNLFTITDWTGTDPEFNRQFGIPQSRTFLVGINVSF